MTRPFLSYTLLLLCLAACTAEYKAIARYTDDPRAGLMTGDIVHDMATGGGTIRMQEYGGETVCEGTAKPASMMSLDGSMDMTCSDGRTVTGHWEATGLTSGTGTATDSKGKRYSLAFGLSDAEVQDYIANQAKTGKAGAGHAKPR